MSPDNFCVTWMAQKHSPDVILDLVSYGCKIKKCGLGSGYVSQGRRIYQPSDMC